MKQSVIIVNLLFVYNVVFAQTPDTTLARIFPLKDGNIYFEKIVTIDSTSKQELFQRAKMWMQKNKSNVHSEFITNKEEGIVSCNIMFSEIMESPQVLLDNTIKSERLYRCNFLHRE